MKRIVPWSPIALAVVLTFLFGATPGPALAQDATPIVGTCDAPELPPGTPTPLEELEEMMGPPSAATPAAGEDATPMAEASPLPDGTPADAETTAQVTTAIANLFACYNTGDYLGFAALYTAAGLLADHGITNPYDAELFLAGGPPLELLSVDEVQVYDDGRYSAEIVYSAGGAQLSRERLLLLAADRYLLVDAVIDLPVEAPEGAVTIDAEMVDYAFVLSETTVPANTPLVFQVTNTGEYPHELVIVQLPAGATAEGILDGSVNFEDVGFFGFTYSEGGQPAPDLVLTGLEPGTYTLVCFIDIPEGIPHIARGMIAELTVE